MIVASAGAGAPVPSDTPESRRASSPSRASANNIREPTATPPSAAPNALRIAPASSSSAIPLPT